MVLTTQPLKLFPQFSVSFGSQHDSRADTNSTIFVIDSLLCVMDLYLPVKTQEAALIAFDVQRNVPTAYSNMRMIVLTAKLKSWSQIAYQLAHEMCHLMIPDEVAPELRWLEESICELSSFFFLPELSKFWKRLNVSLETSDGTLYAPSFEKYALESHADATIMDLALFSAASAKSQLSSLVSDCYQRSKNRYISLRLLPIFERFPSTWHAIPYLSRIPDHLPFPDALAKWIELSPTESRNGLQELAIIFGVTIPLP